MADSTGTPGDEERQSLLRNSNSIDSQHKKRDQLAIEAVAGINQIVDTAGAVLLIALLLVFINQFVDEVIPSWSIFLVLWLGHAVIVLICGSSVRLLLLSIVSKNDRERVSQKWHQANERRIPLLQFAMYHILWIFGLSIALVIFEILLYLALSSQIPTYSIFIVPYILLGIAISNSFVCRSTPTTMAVTWICLLSFCCMANIHLSDSDNDLSWFWIFSPVYALILLWIFTFLYGLLTCLSGIAFKPHQILCIALYCVSFACFGVSTVFGAADLQGTDISGVDSATVALGTLLAGLVLFFVSLSKVVHSQLEVVSSRMGSDRPTEIVRGASGGWEKDPGKGFAVFPLIGEVDVLGPKKDPNEDSDDLYDRSILDKVLCACCASTIELTLWGVGGRTSSSDTHDTRIFSADEEEDSDKP